MLVSTKQMMAHAHTYVGLTHNKIIINKNVIVNEKIFKYNYDSECKTAIPEDGPHECPLALDQEDYVTKAYKCKRKEQEQGYEQERF